MHLTNVWTPLAKQKGGVMALRSVSSLELIIFQPTKNIKILLNTNSYYRTRPTI